MGTIECIKELQIDKYTKINVGDVLQIIDDRNQTVKVLLPNGTKILVAYELINEDENFKWGNMDYE